MLLHSIFCKILSLWHIYVDLCKTYKPNSLFRVNSGTIESNFLGRQNLACLEALRVLTSCDAMIAFFMVYHFLATHTVVLILGATFARLASASIGVWAGGARGAAAPPVLKIFGQNAYDSGKSTWDKLFIESSFYNTTKWSILKRLNGSVCCRSLDAGICCSFASNFLANSQKAVERVRFVKSLLFK